MPQACSTTKPLDNTDPDDRSIPSSERNTEASTYRESLKSTGIVGGSQVVALAISLVRTKAMAVLLGPSGIALFGLYQSATGLIGTLSGMGIPNAGVRQIAEAKSQDNQQRMAESAVSLRRITIVLGVFGAIALYALRVPLSHATFGNDNHAWAIGLLAALIFTQSVAGGYAALIQGARRIKDLAVQRIVGATLSVLIVIPIVFWLGELGVPWAMLIAGIAGAVVTWWFGRRVNIQQVRVSLAATWRESQSLLSLGFSFMLIGLMASVVAYGIKVFVTRNLGLDAMGLFQASERIAGLYVGIVLQAMAADFYPRLTSVATHNAQVNQLVNEQAEISILLAAPGVLATLTLAPTILTVLYSKEFAPATEILRWSILGVFVRVVLWPMEYIALAKGRKRYMLGLNVIANVTHILLVVCFVLAFGLTGVGIAFCALYLVHLCPVYLVARSLSGFSWSRRNYRHWRIVAPTIAATFLATMVLPFWATLTLGGITTLLISLYSLRHLSAMLASTSSNRLLANLDRVNPFRFRRKTPT